MSPFDEDPSENRSELELCIDEIHQLQKKLATATATIARLEEALNNIPVDEYGRAEIEGADAPAAWSSFLEVLAEWKEQALQEPKGD